MADAIARVDALHLAIPSVYGGPQPLRDAQWPEIELVLVRVETAAGLTGWGEAFGHRACATTQAAIESLIAPAALGLDSLDIAETIGRLHRTLHTYGLGGPIGFGLSGLDIALWDIRGHREGLPLCRLLNPGCDGASVPAYASLLRYGDPELAARAAADAVARGHRAVKLHEASVASAAAARAAVGPEVALSLDVNCRWSIAESMTATARLEPLALDWIEEPCWPPTPGALATVAGASATPIAAGENASSIAELERLAIEGKVLCLQPSAAKLGGVSGLLAALDAALRTGARLAPHSAYFGPGLAATVHFCSAFGLTCEWYDCRLDQSPSGFVPIDGCFQLSLAPGLDVEFPHDLIDRYRRDR